MVSHPETGSDPPIGSDRESGSDNTPFWSDPIGRSEPDSRCFVTTISLCQNHLSNTCGSVTFHLA